MSSVISSAVNLRIPEEVWNEDKFIDRFAEVYNRKLINPGARYLNLTSCAKALAKIENYDNSVF